jgi:hypothetical protein
MKVRDSMKWLLVLFLYMQGSKCFAQPSDFLVLKKNGRTLQSYFPGRPMEFSTAQGGVFGIVERVTNDTVFLKQYDVRQVMTRLGVYVLDTAAVYRLAFHYKKILQIDRNKGSFLRATGYSFISGGTLLTVLGAGSWLFTKKNTRYYASPVLVASSAAFAGLGYLLVKHTSKGIKIGKKYKLEYVRVK